MKHLKRSFVFLFFFFSFFSFSIAKDFSLVEFARSMSSWRWYNEIAINVNRLREIRLERYEDERSKNWLLPYLYDIELERTAQVRAETMVQRYGKYPDAKSVHKRNLSDKYFDSKKIATRFASEGVDVKPGQFVENVWYWYLKCPLTGDCTAKARDAIRTTLVFFMSEKPRNWAHYRSIMSAVYTHIGIWFARDKTNNRYRIVIHYANFENKTEKKYQEIDQTGETF